LRIGLVHGSLHFVFHFSINLATDYQIGHKESSSIVSFSFPMISLLSRLFHSTSLALRVDKILSQELKDHDDWDAYRIEIVRLSMVAGRSGGLVVLIDVFGVGC
jgi:hypothetical protein